MIHLRLKYSHLYIQIIFSFLHKWFVTSLSTFHMNKYLLFYYDDRWTQKLLVFFNNNNFNGKIIISGKIPKVEIQIINIQQTWHFVWVCNMFKTYSVNYKGGICVVERESWFHIFIQGHWLAWVEIWFYWMNNILSFLKCMSIFPQTNQFLFLNLKRFWCLNKIKETQFRIWKIRNILMKLSIQGS